MRYSMFLAIVFVSGFLLQPVQVFSQAATLSLKVRKHNDTLFGNDFASQASIVTNINPGDTIEVDMWISDFATISSCSESSSNAGDFCVIDDDCIDGTCVVTAYGGIRGYQIIPDCFTYLTDDCGALIPIGWDAPLVNQNCSEISVCSSESTNQGQICGSDSDCPMGICLSSSECSEPYPICNPRDDPDSAICTGLNFDSRRGAFIKDNICSAGSSNVGDFCSVDGDCSGGTCVVNEDFIFAGAPNPFSGLGLGGLCAYTFGGFVLITSDQVADTGVPRYMGTIILQANDLARGTFSFDIDESSTKSFLSDGMGRLKTITAVPLPLRMVTPCDLPNCFITDSFPDDCSIDARYPWDPNDLGTIFGWDTIDLTFFADLANGCDVGAIVPDDFTVSLTGGGGFPPIIIDVFPINDNTVRLILSKPIPIRRWTCFRFIPADPGFKDEICIAKLPADANASRESNADDIASMMDNLNGKITMDIWQCDSDRGGVCGPIDLLGVIDMLNGGSEFIIFDGSTLSVSCPSAP